MDIVKTYLANKNVIDVNGKIVILLEKLEQMYDIATTYKVLVNNKIMFLTIHHERYIFTEIEE